MSLNNLLSLIKNLVNTCMYNSVAEMEIVCDKYIYTMINDIMGPCVSSGPFY